MDSVHSGGLGGTYGGNPVACAAALGAIATIEQDDLPAAARRIEAVMLPRLRALAEQHPADRRRPRARGDARRSRSCCPARPLPTRARTAAVSARLPRGRARHADLRHLRQRAALPAATGDARGTVGRRAWTSSSRPSPPDPLPSPHPATCVRLSWPFPVMRPRQAHTSRGTGGIVRPSSRVRRTTARPRRAAAGRPPRAPAPPSATVDGSRAQQPVGTRETT